MTLATLTPARAASVGPSAPQYKGRVTQADREIFLGTPGVGCGAASGRRLTYARAGLGRGWGVAAPGNWRRVDVAVQNTSDEAPLPSMTRRRKLTVWQAAE